MNAYRKRNSQYYVLCISLLYLLFFCKSKVVVIFIVVWQIFEGDMFQKEGIHVISSYD